MSEVLDGAHRPLANASASPSYPPCRANRETFSPALGSRVGGIVAPGAQKALERGQTLPCPKAVSRVRVADDSSCRAGHLH